LLVHTVLVQTVTFLLRPATSYRALELGVEPAWLGAARFFLGALARRFGRERLLVGSAVRCPLSRWPCCRCRCRSRC
jgi:hypothetical protein